MKYTVFLCSFLLSSVFTFGKAPAFHVRYSQPLAVFKFVEQLAPYYPDNPFKKEFTKSSYNTEKYRELVEQFSRMSLNYSYKYSEFPYSSKVPGMTTGLLKKNLIASKDLEDFKLRSVGVIPNSSLDQLIAILSAFTPIYNELIYTPNKEKFEIQLAALSEYVTNKDIAEYFEQGLLFYHSEWDPSIPFEMIFYPLPNSRGFTAEAFYNNSVSAIPLELKNYSVLMSVMLHEIYHILYDEQSLEVKNDLAGYFQQNVSPCSQYAYLLLNEVLATAVGNGYVYEKLNGRTDTADWYNIKYINLMAKKVYPLVKEYITDHKPIDKRFVDMYVQLYEKDFSGWIYELNHVMTYRTLLTTDMADIDAISKAFPHYSNSETEMESELSETGVQSLSRLPITKIVVVSSAHSAKLKMIKGQFPELKNWKYNADKEFVYNVFLTDKTQLYVINRRQSTTTDLLNNHSMWNK